MSLTVIVYIAVEQEEEAAIERRPSHFHPLSFHLSHSSNILQYRGKSTHTLSHNMYRTYDCSENREHTVEKRSSNLHPLSFASHTS